MIEHVSMGTHRYPEAVAFYRHALAPLGMALLRDTGAEAAFGMPSHWSFFLYPVPVQGQVVAKGMHVALVALSRAFVAQVHAAALAAGAHDIFAHANGPTSARPTLAPCSATSTVTESKC